MFKYFQVKTLSEDVAAPANLLKKRLVLALVFSCEFWEL